MRSPSRAMAKLSGRPVFPAPPWCSVLRRKRSNPSWQQRRFVPGVRESGLVSKKKAAAEMSCSPQRASER